MIRNIHHRVLPVPASEVGPLLDRIAEPGNALWPGDSWPPMVLDRPLGVGADGGHGMVRYTCTAYQPGVLVEFTFAPSFLVNGKHVLEIVDLGENSCELRHLAICTPNGVRGWLLWHFVIHWMHNALLGDLLDRAAVAVGHPPARPARWSPWVRLMRRALGRQPVNRPLVASAH